MKKIWDISPPISPLTAVYPGDVPYSRAVSLEFPKDHLTLSAITTTLHIGAHTDAPIHYHAQGQSIDQRPLERYIGECQVIAVKIPKGERIRPADLRTKILAPRVLFKTGSFPDPNRWNADFNSLSPELVDFLAAEKVVLVGIDTPSVDPADSKKLESHQAIYQKDMAILEGIVLEVVPEGLYTLVALPLPLKDADASPVRAVLLQN